MSEEISRLGGPKNIHEPLSAPNQAADRSSQEIYEFGPFRLQPAERKLLRDGVVVALTPKVFDMLVILVRNSNHLLDKSELMRLLWPDSFVEDGNLSNSIFVLRKALGNNHEYIETVPTRGYRFVGAVRQLPPTATNTISGALEVLRWEASGNRKLRARNILLAGIAAALLLFAAVFFAPRYRRASSAPMPSLPHFVMEQRLTANPPDVPVHDAVVSPDGKYVAYADPTGLYLRQVSSGDTRSLALQKGFVATPRSWYPDGTHLLVVKPGLGSDPPSLYRLSILGGEPQEINGDARDGFVSPDGSRIAYLPSANWGDLWIMDSTGTHARKLVSGREPISNGIFQDWIYRVAWSPTGQYLACIESHAFNGPNLLEPTHSLRIIGPNGEGVAVVLDGARLGTPVWWAPDGRILFSYREGASTQNNYGVYSVPPMASISCFGGSTRRHKPLSLHSTPNPTCGASLAAWYPMPTKPMQRPGSQIARPSCSPPIATATGNFSDRRSTKPPPRNSQGGAASLYHASARMESRHCICPHPVPTKYLFLLSS